MDGEPVFDVWVPRAALWSPWAKPVLFAHIKYMNDYSQVTFEEIQIERPKSAGTAIVVDLPGIESIGLGLELARLGFRPVPLFNACPAPSVYVGDIIPEAVPTHALLAALVQVAEHLKSIDLPKDSPPAFLLDSNRLAEGKPIVPGLFDNRWVVFKTDFPSAGLLLRHEIKQVEFIHRSQPREDILDVLRDWSQSGILLHHIDLAHPGPPNPLKPKPAWLSSLSRFGRRIWAMMNLRPSPRGGYGGIVPESASSGG